MREDGHMLAALNREQFRPGYTRDERLRVVRERHHAIGRAVHNQDWDCNLFQRVRRGSRYGNVVVCSREPQCHPIEGAHQ
jgi:hypothetical protein